MKSLLQKRKIFLNKGFTLVELLITLSIFAVTTGIVMFSQNKFDNSVLLTNLAYDMAITIRQAQAYGVNVKEHILLNGQGSFNPYGVYFSASDSTHYLMFSDTIGGQNSKGDFLYNSKDMSCPTTDSECVNRYALKRGDHIVSFCTGANETACDQQIIGGQIDSLRILFKRPEPDAKIFVGEDTFTSLGYAKITVSSADGNSKRSVVVTNTGQIYVK
ncbi:MAG: type II secretion system protein [Candidatus Paceibacterota bacterium]|jgi:prepilin-type N-terminal cleavage/methylation domain-containing protein